MSIVFGFTKWRNPRLNFSHFDTKSWRAVLNFGFVSMALVKGPSAGIRAFYA